MFRALLIASLVCAALAKCPPKAKNDGCFEPGGVTCDDSHTGPNCEPQYIPSLESGCPSCAKCRYCPANTDACCGGAGSRFNCNNTQPCQLLCGITTIGFQGGCNADPNPAVYPIDGCPGDFLCRRYVNKMPPTGYKVDCLCQTTPFFGCAYIENTANADCYNPAVCEGTSPTNTSDALQTFFCVRRDASGNDEWLGGVARQDLKVNVPSAASAVAAVSLVTFAAALAAAALI